MNVFISYSVSDIALVRSISQQIAPFGMAKYWDKDNQPGNETWPTIFNWIDNSALVVAVITDKTISRAFSVGQEVGHAKKGNKKIIPIVAKGIPVSDLGCLAGITHIPLDPENPAAAIGTLQKQVMLQRLQNEQNTKAALVIGGLIIFAMLASD